MLPCGLLVEQSDSGRERGMSSAGHTAGRNEQGGEACELCGRRDIHLNAIRGAEGDHFLCDDDNRRLEGVVTNVEQWLDWSDVVTRQRAIDLLRTRLEPIGV